MRMGVAGLVVGVVAAVVSAEDGRAIRTRVVNAGAHRISAVYVSPTSSPSWGDNLLAKGKRLAPRQAVEVVFPGACGRYDVRIVAAGGVEYLLDAEDFCDDGDQLTVGDHVATLSRAR